MYKIGNTLKTLRTSNGLSIIEVIKKFAEINIPIKAKTIYRWENNTCIPDIKTINILSHIYGVSLTSIYEDDAFCKSLNKYENDFINCLRNNKTYKKIIKLLANIDSDDMEEMLND